MLIDFREDVVMFSACYLKLFSTIVFLTFITSYIVYADVLFSISIFFLGFLYLALSYFFYVKNINASRDVLLKKLEKKGRKELQIEDSAESIKLSKKTIPCSLPPHPANAKEFELSILYLGHEHLTIYSKCPPSNIYTIHKKKAAGDFKKKPVEACAENREYYYSYIQSVHFKKDIILILNSGEEIEIAAGKGPAKKAVLKIRKHLRKTEKDWVDHARGSHKVKHY
ncbi:MAG TPA: hypothetical protein EYH01_02925 [Campylobacterales bacterium]|nr:hypothetical protein [Campylobacterales bacterium]